MAIRLNFIATGGTHTDNRFAIEYTVPILEDLNGFSAIDQINRHGRMATRLVTLQSVIVSCRYYCPASTGWYWFIAGSANSVTRPSDQVISILSMESKSPIPNLMNDEVWELRICPRAFTRADS